tara:strand:- start:129 stop:1073 length:945 start_codon:yes stop_codon:yes gene_type:complete
MKVLVTGGSGLVGTAFKRAESKGIDWEILDGPSNGGVDLMDRKKVFELFSSLEVDAVVHTAARVGGIKANIKNPHSFYSENIQINTNVLDACKNSGIKKCVSFLSTCVYPDKSDYPLAEDKIHSGPPHDSNEFYAYAKRMLDVHSRAISSERGFNYFCVSPNNLYGINDNFSSENSHVIPGIISKVHEAGLSNKRVLKLWGDGTPLREFTFADDIPDVIAFLLKKRVSGVLNIGNNKREYSINEVANDILSLMESNLKIKWESKKLNGQLRKPSSSVKIDSLKYDSKNYTNLRLGLKNTIHWFLENYPNVRGID